MASNANTKRLAGASLFVFSEQTILLSTLLSDGAMWPENKKPGDYIF